MKKFFLSFMAAAAIASATPYTYVFNDPYAGQNPGTAANNGDVVGQLRRFDIEKVTINGDGGSVFISVFMNYGQNGGDTSLGGISIGSFPTLNPGDIMIRSGADKYSIPLVSHTNSAVGAGGLTGGDLYRVNAFRTAAQVLGSPSGSYRPEAAVWGQATGAVKLGDGTVSTSLVGGSEIRVDMSVTTSNLAFIQALSSGNFDLLFASATCGNDIVIGTAVPNDGNVPEPMTMAMIGSGLVALGISRRRK